ncbi:hypothetical protein HN51_055900 [Arachis hypogaea]
MFHTNGLGWTERPYEASLFPGIGFGLFLRSLGGGSPHLHRHVYFTEPLSETVPRSLRLFLGGLSFKCTAKLFSGEAESGTTNPFMINRFSMDPIEFHSEEESESYKNRMDSYQRKTGLTEAVQTGTGQPSRRCELLGKISLLSLE